MSEEPVVSEPEGASDEVKQRWYAAAEALAAAREEYRAAQQACRDAGWEPGDPPEDPADRPVEPPEVVLAAMVKQAGYSPEEAAKALSEMKPETQVAEAPGVESQATAGGNG